jgi:16S rRNA C967 or C1407 C5-methylase (RsmB/RsmF family)
MFDPFSLLSFPMTTSYRYFRKGPKFTNDSPLPHNATAVTWLPDSYNFFRIPTSTPFAKSDQIIGMDAASAAAVVAMQLEQLPPGSCVWDMCSAPGMKWMLMVDQVRGKDIRVVATDVSEARLRVMRNLAKKFGYTEEFRRDVFRSDRVLFESLVVGSKNRVSKKRKIQISSSLDSSSFPTGRLFDRVLVDAECTHDGSERHVAKHQDGGFWNREGEQKTERFPYSDPQKFSNLLTLQRALISGGFNRLAPGGLMVYSTCSLDKRQNEDIVQFLLDKYEEAQLQPLPFDPVPATRVLEHCWLFDPESSGTSGLFIALVRKRE